MFLYSLNYFLLFNYVYSIVRFGLNPPNNILSLNNNNKQEERHLHSIKKDIIRTRLIILPEIKPKHEINELIEFELFDNKLYIGKVENYVLNSIESISWFGSLKLSNEEDPNNENVESNFNEGSFELSCYINACVANIKLSLLNEEYIISPSSNHKIEADGTGIYELSQFSNEKKKSGLATSTENYVIHDLHNKVSKLKREKSNIETQAVDTDLILDCFVMYTPEALAKIGGR